MMRTLLILSISLLLWTTSCSTRQMAVRMAGPLMIDQYNALNEESDPQLAAEALPASLKMLEGLTKSDSENIDLYTRLAEGFCSYAFSFVEDADPARASGLYLRGRDYALRVLALQGFAPGWEQVPPADFEATLKTMSPDQLPAVFWLAQCWAGWLMLNLNDVEAFPVIPKVEAAMLKVLKWDETYHYAGPHMFLGVFYGSRPKMLGGDLEKSRRHFERTLALTEGKFLVAQLLYAKTLAVQTQDEDLFERMLKTVIDAPVDLLPEQRLANAVARAKALKLLERKNDLF